MSTHSIAGQRPRASARGSGAFFMVATLLLGLLVGVLALVSVLMWADAHDARKGTTKPTVNHQMAVMPGMPACRPETCPPLPARSAR